MKLLYPLIILFAFFISCSNNSILNPILEDTPACEWWEFWCEESIEPEDCAGVSDGNGTLCIDNTQIEVDKFENELFLQAEVTHDNSNILSVTTELSIYNGGIYNFLGSFFS